MCCALAARYRLVAKAAVGIEGLLFDPSTVEGVDASGGKPQVGKGAGIEPTGSSGKYLLGNPKRAPSYRDTVVAQRQGPQLVLSQWIFSCNALAKTCAYGTYHGVKVAGQ